MPRDPPSKKPRESRKGKEKLYHDDGRRDRDTPRVVYQSTGGGREGYNHPGEASQSPADQLEYPGRNQDTWTSVPESFENLSVGPPSSPVSRSNYTTDPPQYGPSTTYQSTYPAVSYAVPSSAAGSTYSATSTASGYTSYYGGNQSADAPATYPTTTTQAPDSPSYTANPGSYQTAASSTHYSQTSYVSSYAPSAGQTAQSQGYSYSTETAHPTTYSTSPSYQTTQGFTAAQSYNPTTADAPQPSDYPARDPERHTPAPVTIKQCGCLGCDVDGAPDGRPKLKDGKDEHKRPSSSSKKTDSSRSKHSSSSKKRDSSKSKAVSTSASFEIRRATVDIQNGNMNCGALYLYDIKPWAKPQPPGTGSSREEERDYKARLERWKEESKAWRDSSCPCRYGYFNTNGHWVAGSHVRKYLREGPDAEGAAPPNPRWENNGGMAPEQPGVEKKT